MATYQIPIDVRYDLVQSGDWHHEWTDEQQEAVIDRVATAWAEALAAVVAERHPELDVEAVRVSDGYTGPQSHDCRRPPGDGEEDGGLWQAAWDRIDVQRLVVMALGGTAHRAVAEWAQEEKSSSDRR